MIYLWAIQKGVFDLDADELSPPVDVGYVVHLGELPHFDVRSSNVPNFPRDNKVMKSLHGLFKRRRRVKSVYLKKVDVGRIESGQRGIDLIYESGAREATLIHEVPRITQGRVECGNDGWVGADQEHSFGHDDHVLSGYIVLGEMSVL